MIRAIVTVALIAAGYLAEKITHSLKRIIK